MIASPDSLAPGPGYEVIFTTIEDLTHDGRDRSLDYKLSSIDVPKGHRHAQVSANVHTIMGVGPCALVPHTRVA